MGEGVVKNMTFSRYIIYGWPLNKTRAAVSPANVNKLACLNKWLDL